MSSTSNGDVQDARRAAWTRYWSGGNLHSLGTSFTGNYEGGIAAFWISVFTTLANGRHVLDICTGNGALPLLLRDALPDAGIEVDAVDLAELAPAWHAALAPEARARIRFHGGVRAEALPFADGSFDLAVSQYGIEYTNHGASIDELARTLRGNGACAFVIHHSGSQLLAVAQDEMASATRLLAEDGMLQQAKPMLPLLQQVAEGHAQRLKDDAQANQVRAAFNASMQLVSAAAADMKHPTLLLDAQQWVSGMAQAILQRQVDATRAARLLADYREDITLARLRNEELCQCAMDEDGIARFATRLEVAGFSNIEYAPLHHGHYLVGWQLQARR